MIVLTNEGNPNVLKLIVAAKMARQPITVKTVSSNAGYLGRLPILELPSGSRLFSTSAAMQLVLPPSEELIIRTNKWLEWDATQLQAAVVCCDNVGVYKNSTKSYLMDLIQDLSRELKDSTYLIEEKSDFSTADVSIWVTLWSTIMATDISKEISEKYPHVANWLTKIEAHPIVQEALKENEFERGIKAIASIQAASWFPINSVLPVKSATQILNLDSPTKEKEVETVSKEEIAVVSENWLSASYAEVKNADYPVLPKKGEKNVLVTSALPYVNNVPHLGNIIGCVLSADIFARYCRQRNYNTLYISGTDEYGTATEAKALEEKSTPQEICDKFFSIHNDVYRWFGIGFDYFGRTTTTEQTEIVQSFFLKIKAKGYVSSESVDQLLCETCDRFLADRFVEGVCPRCKYEDARGDQCDGCGHLVNATELINPRCKVCSSGPVVKKSTQFFLDLPKLEGRLKEWSATVEHQWSPVARAVTKPWLRDGLKPRCISRDLKWGIPVPVKGFENKVFYVWFDALFGYISITKRYTKDFEKWWKPEDTKVTLYQFMAKDNVPFHSIMFPAYLLAVDENYTLLGHLMATEYLNYEDTKFSKSRGIGVFGTDAKKTGIPADVWRFYLAYIRPESQDSNFNWADLATKNNSELLNNLGNFVNRALVFAERFFNAQVPPMALEEDDLTLLALAQRELTAYIAALEQAKLRDGLKHVLMISKHGNQYVQSQQPWAKLKGSKDDKKRAATVVGVSCNLACLLSALLAPYMPNTAREIRKQLGLDNRNYGYIPDTITSMVKCGHKIGKPSPLFAKIDESLVQSLRAKYAGKQDTNEKSGSANVPNVSEDVKSIEDAIAKQGALVRELKGKQDKSVWQPEVKILLDLKKKLADLTAGTTKVEESSPAKNQSETVPQENGAAIDVTTLEGKIAKQGNLVRELKSKAEKSVWQPQVEVLLKLKKELAALTGAATSATNDKKAKKKK